MPHKEGSMISFDGTRLTYVGETGAFCLYVWQTESEMYDAAVSGCVTWREAEAAVAECAAYLSRMVTLMKEEVA